MILSLLFFFFSLFVARQSAASALGRLSFGVFSLLFLIVSFCFFVADYFTGNGIDESALYHFRYGLAGAGFTEYGPLIAISGILTLSSLFFIFRFSSAGRKGELPERGGKAPLSFFLISAALFVNPGSKDLFDLFYPFPPVEKGEVGASTQNNVSKQHTGDPSRFEYHYRKPEITKRPAAPRNLVFIYAESLERTYFDEKLFPGLIKGLRKLEEKSTSFTNVTQVRNTGWTIAGVAASQCGFPLFAASHSNTMSGMDTFLSNADCLGDLLHREGYYLAYLGGASLDFAGKGKFYATHAFDEVKGRDELLPLLPDKKYRSGWGLYDDSLLQIAYDKFEELSARGNNFAFFTLTLDTHHPDGHPSKSCKGKEYGDGSNPILNAVACSDYLVSEFVAKIMNSPSGKKTVIVIASDHLAMRNSATSLLRKGKRRNLFMIIDPTKENPERVAKKGSTLDIGPTLLSSLGFDGAIGLGRNLLSEEETLVGLDDFNDRLMSWKPDIVAFWDFPKIEKNIEIDATKKEMKIDKRAFRLPILVSFNERMETELRFQFDILIHKKLADHVKDFDDATPFIWVDKCSVISTYTGKGEKKGYCFVVGKKGAGEGVVKRVEGPVTFAIDELKRLVLLKRDEREIKLSSK